MNNAQRIIRDILNLEKINMTPILNHYGKHFNESMILADIERYNTKLSNIYYSYSDEDILQCYYRYNFDEENNIIVRSIQLNQNNIGPTNLKKLLNNAYKQLISIKEELKIYAWVHTYNSKSIRLLEKLNFKFETGQRDASKFFIYKSKLLSTLEEKGFNF